jgi:hypothetical protein
MPHVRLKRVKNYIPALITPHFTLTVLLLSHQRSNLVVERILRISKIKDHTRVRLSTTTVGELLGEVNRAVERKTAVFVEVDIERLEVSRGVDDTNIASLDEIVGDDQVLLVRCDLEIVRSNGRLVLIGVIQALDVAEITDI